MIAMALALEPRADDRRRADDRPRRDDPGPGPRAPPPADRPRPGPPLILITHDLGVVAGMTQRINVMYAGLHRRDARRPPTCSPTPSHPYTVGLLHSIPRLDAERTEELIPIEGRPPDQRSAPVGCPFAPRCAWRSIGAGRTTRGSPRPSPEAGRHERRRARPTGSPATTRRRARRRSPAVRSARASRRRLRPARDADELAGAATRAVHARRAGSARAPAATRPATYLDGAATRRSRAGSPGPACRSRPRIVTMTGPGMTADRRAAADGAAGERADRARTDAGPLLRVEDLQVYFPITEGLIRERHIGDVRAVDDVTFETGPRRDARAGRRVGLRQDRRPAGRSSGCTSRPPAGSSSTGRTSRRCPGQGPARRCAAGCR